MQFVPEAHFVRRADASAKLHSFTGDQGPRPTWRGPFTLQEHLVQNPVLITDPRVPHISLVFREMWDAAALRFTFLTLPQNTRNKICGIPHLAKNERDVGHPWVCDRT